jgi:recombination protein RecA
MSKLSTLVAKFNKDHDKEIATLGVGGIQREDPERLPTGIFQLDLATGGGIPVGRVSVIFGPESSMKTTLCFKLIASAQKRWPDKKCVFVDLEDSMSAKWAQRMGVNTETLAYAKPQHAEQAVDLIESLVYAEDVSLIVVDSLAAMVTQHELDSPAEKAMVGTQGILINKLYRKLTRAMSVSKDSGNTPTVVCINQIRFKVGTVYGDPETMPGGQSFKYAASMVLRLYGKDEFVKEVSKSLPAFKKISAIVKKWKVPITSRSCEFMLALLPNEKLKLDVGDSYDAATVTHYLKHYELMVKAGKSGWAIRDEHGEILAEAKTQDALETKMRDDDAFREQVRALIVRVVIEKGDHIDPD